MILCVNANAAIDRTVRVHHLRVGEINRPEQVVALAGGKACNIARALKCLGERAVVTGWVGGFNGQFIETQLKSEGIDAAFFQLESESRICLSILDAETNTSTELYEPGNAIPSEKIAEFINFFGREISNYSGVTLSGSLPPGVPADFYATLIRLASDARVPTFLDGGGEALRLGIAARPTLVKPNRSEFEELLQTKFSSVAECATFARDTAEKYQTTLVVSLGAEGIVAVRDGQAFQAASPSVRALSAVGSGDSLLAGLMIGLGRSLSFPDLLRYGVAAGTANTLSIGAGIFSRADFEALLSRVDCLAL